MDSDGDVDLVSTSETHGTVAWFENTGGDGNEWEYHEIDTSLGGGRKRPMNAKWHAKFISSAQRFKPGATGHGTLSRKARKCDTSRCHHAILSQVRFRCMPVTLTAMAMSTSSLPATVTTLLSGMRTWTGAARAGASKLLLQMIWWVDRVGVSFHTRCGIDWIFPRLYL